MRSEPRWVQPGESWSRPTTTGIASHAIPETLRTMSWTGRDAFRSSGRSDAGRGKRELLLRDRNHAARSQHLQRPHVCQDGSIFRRDVRFSPVETRSKKLIPDPDHWPADDQEQPRRELEP